MIQAETLFDVLSNGSVEMHTDESLVTLDDPVLDATVENTGLYVNIADREQHIRNTHIALSQLALASRGIAAVKGQAAQRIRAEKGVTAEAYLAKIRQRTERRLGQARAAYMASVNADIPESEVDPRLAGWYNFRTTYINPANRKQRDDYRRDLRKHAANFGYELPEES